MSGSELQDLSGSGRTPVITRGLGHPEGIYSVRQGLKKSV